MTQYERMEKGLLYDPMDPTLLKEQVPYQDRLWAPSAQLRHATRPVSRIGVWMPNIRFLLPSSSVILLFQSVCPPALVVDSHNFRFLKHKDTTFSRSLLVTLLQIRSLSVTTICRKYLVLHGIQHWDSVTTGYGLRPGIQYGRTSGGNPNYHP